MPRKKTPEEYYNECKAKGYDLPIENYIDTKTKIKHKCNRCGNIYEQTPNKHLIRGQGCRKCGRRKMIISRTGKTKKKTTEEYIKECKEKGLDLPIEDYKGANIKINHKCKQGHIYPQRPSNHLKGHRCPKCKGNYSYTSEEYIQECKEKGLDLPIEDYVNAKTEINHICQKGHIYSQTPHKHLNRKQGCPVCSESHGEKFIRNYLDKHNIKYKPQKKFKDLKDKTYLSYDFYLPDYNILIEYQGIQHYESIDYFGGKSKFKKQQYHDIIKQRFAEENRYRLLRPTYKTDTQEKINRYLNRYLVK